MREDCSISLTIEAGEMRDTDPVILSRQTPRMASIRSEYIRCYKTYINNVRFILVWATVKGLGEGK
jgi:hypothetical protein